MIQLNNNAPNNAQMINAFGNRPPAAAPDAKAQAKALKALSGITAFKALTGGFDKLIAQPSAKGLSKKDVQLRDNAVSLFTALAGADRKNAGEFTWQIDTSTKLKFSWTGDGQPVRVTQLDKRGNEIAAKSAALESSADQLLTRLADEICARGDVFRSSFGKMLEAFPANPNNNVSIAPTLQRSFCESVISHLAGVHADKLANVTTANLLNIARTTVMLQEKYQGGFAGEISRSDFVSPENGAGGVGQDKLCDAYVRCLKQLGVDENEINKFNKGGKANASYADFRNKDFSKKANGDVDGFEIVVSPREYVEACIQELDTVMAQNVLTSADAVVLIEAMQRDVQAKDKVRLADNLNLEQKTGFKENKKLTNVAKIQRQNEAKAQVVAQQRLRNFAADLLMVEDPSVQDADDKLHMPLGTSLVNTIRRHADTLAQLLVDRETDDKTAFSGLCEEGRELLEALLDGDGNFFKGLTTTMGITADDIIAAARSSNGKKALADKIRTWDANFPTLGKLGTVMSMAKGKVNEAFVKQQKTIQEQLNGMFTGGEVKKAINCNGIDAMMSNALKPSDTGYVGFVKELLSRYFGVADANKGEQAQISKTDKLSMAAAMLRYAPEKATEGQIFGALLKGAGPLLQKILQGLDSNLLGGSEMAQAVKDMKKNLAPIPEEIVRANLHDIVERSGGKLTNIEAKKVLGCATVGEAILCTAHGPGLPPEGKEVVVKILRPDALQRINREKALVLEVAEKCGMKAAYQAQLDAILEEFDFKREAHNIEAAQVYDNRKAYPNTGVVKIETIVSPTTGTLVMERAPGETAEDVITHAGTLLDRCDPTSLGLFSSRNAVAKAPTPTSKQVKTMLGQLKAQCRKLEKLQKDLVDMSGQWVTEGLYKSGFFHGDLHGGNIMLDFKKGATMIDFGNVTQLTAQERDNITKMMAAAGLSEDNAVGSPAAKTCVKCFLEGLKDMLSPSQVRKLEEMNQGKAVEQMLAKVLTSGKAVDAGKRILVALTEIDRMGIGIPAQVFKFSQSQMRLQNTIESVNSMLTRTVHFIHLLSGTLPKDYTTNFSPPTQGVSLSMNMAAGAIGPNQDGDLPDRTVKNNTKSAAANSNVTNAKTMLEEMKSKQNDVKDFHAQQLTRSNDLIDLSSSPLDPVVKWLDDPELTQMWKTLCDKHRASKNKDGAVDANSPFKPLPVKVTLPALKGLGKKIDGEKTILDSLELKDPANFVKNLEGLLKDSKIGDAKSKDELVKTLTDRFTVAEGFDTEDERTALMLLLEDESVNAMLEAIKHEDMDTQSLDQLKNNFLDRLVKVETDATEDMVNAMVENMEIGKKPPETFADRMGSVILQNLVTTTKRLSLELVNAIKNN